MKPNESANDLTITVAEAAAWLRIGKNQVYRAVKHHQLPSVRVGRRILIPRVALQRWLDGS